MMAAMPFMLSDWLILQKSPFQKDVDHKTKMATTNKAIE
jgi:hypothetical protein